MKRKIQEQRFRGLAFQVETAARADSRAGLFQCVLEHEASSVTGVVQQATYHVR